MTIKKQPNGSYHVRVRFTDNLGKPSEKNNTFETKTLAQMWEAQTKIDAQQGKFNKNFLRANATINEVFEQWFKEYSRGKRKVTTDRARNYVETNILTHEWFDGVPVANIDKTKAQTWTDWMAGQQNSYRFVVSKFRAIMKFAVKRDLIDANPFDKVDMPTPIEKQVRPDANEFYTKAQLQTFLNAIQSKYNERKQAEQLAILYLLATTGMRIGEIRALTWDDMHLETSEPYISVDKTRAYDVDDGEIINPPKTKAGKRKVLINQTARNLLIQWHIEQSKHLGGTLQIVFTNLHFKDAISRATVDNWYKAALKETDLPRLTLHGFRHTFVTLGLQGGANVKGIQSLVGHEDASTTLNIYAGVTDEMRTETVQKFNSIIDNAI